METLHYTPRYFANPTHPISITVIGCGGTGSLLLPRLARIDFALKQLNHPGLSLTCFDDDIVENHNIGRQNFSINDIGSFKAFQLISKINMAFGLEWKAVNKRMEEVPKSNIIITCVDNVACRNLIANAKYSAYNFNQKTNAYWLDCGNGKDFGQVVLGTLNPIEQPNDNCASSLKTVVDIYGNLKQYDNQEIQGIESCSYIDAILKQDLFVNDEIALSASKIIWKLLKSTTINIQGYIINQKVGQSKPFLISKS